MSKKDLIEWSEEQQTEARAEGWEMCICVENGSTHGRWQIFGVGVTNQEMTRHVIAQAKRGSKLHIAALRTVVQSQMPGAKKTRR